MISAAAAAAPHHLSSRSLHQFSLRSSVLRFIRRESDTSIFIRTSERANDILVVSPKTAYQKSSPALRPTKSGPDFCPISVGFALSISLALLSSPLLSISIFFIFFVRLERGRGLSIDRLLFAISRLEPAARARLESDGDDYKVARIEGGRPKTKTGYLRISRGIYLIARGRPSTIFCHRRPLPLCFFEREEVRR